MIRATNQLTEKERKDAKNIDCQLPSLGPTYREPYLSNMLNFDFNTPAFFFYYQNGGCLVY